VKQRSGISGNRSGTPKKCSGKEKIPYYNRSNALACLKSLQSDKKPKPIETARVQTKNVLQITVKKKSIYAL